jgi:hypothetical protein
VIGQFQKSDLEQICDDRFLLFGNRGKAIHKDKINSLDHSLLLIKPKEFEVVERRYDDNEYPQQRLLFKFNSVAFRSDKGTLESISGHDDTVSSSFMAINKLRESTVMIKIDAV